MLLLIIFYIYFFGQLALSVSVLLLRALQVEKLYKLLLKSQFLLNRQLAPPAAVLRLELTAKSPTSYLKRPTSSACTRITLRASSEKSSTSNNTERSRMTPQR